jgi:hypothetical protein
MQGGSDDRNEEVSAVCGTPDRLGIPMSGLSIVWLLSPCDPRTRIAHDTFYQKFACGIMCVPHEESIIEVWNGAMLQLTTARLH